MNATKVAHHLAYEFSDSFGGEEMNSRNPILKMYVSTPLLIMLALVAFGPLSFQQEAWALDTAAIRVVSTLSDYAAIAREIGGNKVEVNYICHGDEDPHFVRPKPSFAVTLSKAELFLSTGLDLELWAPTVIDKSMNPVIREGQIGYVAVSDGVKLREIPTVADRSEGGVHIYGNPHIHTSPINARHIATNIAIGFKKVDPASGPFYEENLKKFIDGIDESLFGAELVSLLGGDTLCRLAESGNLIAFLSSKEYGDKKLIDLLGGWLKKAMPLRGRKIVTYHRNWIYFTDLFGFNVLGEVEPKPSIPPSPKDVKRLINLMKDHQVKVVLAANYYNESKVMKITHAVGSTPVIVPMSVDGIPEVKTIFQLYDFWIERLIEAYKG